MPESPSSYPTAPRTIEEVNQERGTQNYPHKQNDIKNKKDRTDFLIAAYALIRKRDMGFLMRLLKMSPTNRMILIRSFPSAEGQFRLEGMFKKIISFDQNEKVTTLVPDDIVRLLLELRDMFEPETELPRDFLPPPAATKKVAPVVVQKVTGILNRKPIDPTPASKKISASTSNKETLQTRSTLQPAPLIESRSNGGSKQNTESEDIHIPAFLRKRRAISPTPIPRRERPQPHYHTPEPIVTPPTDRQKTEFVSRLKSPTPPEIPEVPQPTLRLVSFPETLGYEASLDWLRNEPIVQVGLGAVQEIPAYTRDDLSIMALFNREYPVLYTAFTRLHKLSSHGKTSSDFCLDIIHDIYHPDPLLILKKEPEVLQLIRICFEHHKKGEHAEFSRSLRELMLDENIAGKIGEIFEKYKAKSFMEVLALIIDFPWTPEDARMYESVSLRSILEHTHGFSSLKQTIEKLPSTVSYKELQKKLNTLSIVAPSGDTSWTRYKLKNVTPSTLLTLLEVLIKKDLEYKKDDETSTKKLRRKLTEIVG